MQVKKGLVNGKVSIKELTEECYKVRVKGTEENSRSFISYVAEILEEHWGSGGGVTSEKIWTGKYILSSEAREGQVIGRKVDRKPNKKDVKVSKNNNKNRSERDESEAGAQGCGKQVQSSITATRWEKCGIVWRSEHAHIGVLRERSRFAKQQWEARNPGSLSWSSRVYSSEKATLVGRALREITLSGLTRSPWRHTGEQKDLGKFQRAQRRRWPLASYW